MTLRIERLGAGAPLVLLHGWGFHSSIWSGLAEALAARHRVHLVDLPGHGRSRELRMGTCDEVADAIAGEVPDASLVCGWSLGGILAQRLAQRHPQRVRALALLSTTPCFARRPDWPHGMAPETLDAFAADLRREPVRTLTRFLRLNGLGGSAARSSIRELERGLGERPLPSAQGLEAGLEMLRSVDLRATPAFNVPTVIVHGARDRIVPPEAGRWLAHGKAATRFVALEDAAHLPFATHRGAVLAALASLDG